MQPSTPLQPHPSQHDLRASAHYARGSRWNEHKPLHFPTQRPGEHVVLLLRRHWTVLAGDVVQLIVSLLVPPVILTLIYFYTDFTLQPSSLLYVFVVEGLSLYTLFSFLAYFHDFVDYHLDIWVVTDQRIVSIEQEGLFNRTVSELNLMKMQDVTAEVKGKIQTFLDFGEVYIQTAGEAARFVFSQVPHPSQVAKVILQVHDRLIAREEMERIRETETYKQQLRTVHPITDIGTSHQSDSHSAELPQGSIVPRRPTSPRHHL